MIRSILKSIVAGLWGICLWSAPGAAAAHHTAAVYFGTSTVIEVPGVLTDVRWQNPHIGSTLLSREDDVEVEWLVESNSAAICTSSEYRDSS